MEKFEKEDEMIALHHKPNIIRVVILGTCFTFLFSAFATAQNLVVPLYTDLNFEGLGSIALFSLYIFFALTCFFSSIIVDKIGSLKVVFILSGLGYNLFVGFGFLIVHCEKDEKTNEVPDYFFCNSGFVYPVVIVCSMLCGICAGTIWVSQGSYIEILGRKCQTKKGFYVGLFWSIFQVSQVLGNTLGYFLLGDSKLTYFGIMLAIGGCGNAMFIFLPSANDPGIQVEKQEADLKKMIKLGTNKKTFPLICIMAYSGIVVAFYSGFLGQLIEISLTTTQLDDPNVKNQMTSAIYIVLGISEVSAGLLGGFLTDRFNLYTLCTIGTILTEIGLLISLLAYYIKNYLMTFFVGGIWGFCDCYFNSLLQSVCNQDYPGKIEIFGIYKLVQSLSTGIFDILPLFIKDPLVFIILIFGLQMLANLSSRLLRKPKFASQDSYEFLEDDGISKLSSDSFEKRSVDEAKQRLINGYQ